MTPNDSSTWTMSPFFFEHTGFSFDLSERALEATGWYLIQYQNAFGYVFLIGTAGGDRWPSCADQIYRKSKKHRARSFFGSFFRRAQFHPSRQSYSTIGRQPLDRHSLDVEIQ